MDSHHDHEANKNHNLRTEETKPETNNLHVTPTPTVPGAAEVPAVENKNLKSKKLILIVAGVAVLALSAGAYLFLSRESTPVVEAPAQTSAKLGVAVTLIDGTAQYSTDGQNWQPLTTDYQPVEGDWIETVAASRAILTLDDGSSVRLDETTTIKLVSLDTEDVRIDNVAGEVYSRVVASERSYRVHVEDTDYKALGTAYKTINTTADKGVQVYHSTVSVEGTETKVTEGKQFYKNHTNTALKDVLSDVSVDEMKSDSFMVWNLEQDKQSTEFKDKLGYLAKIEEQPTPPAAAAPATASIKLTGKIAEKGVTLNWSVSKIGTVEGFKVVRSKKTTTPTYGKDEANFASGASARTLIWKDGSGITYHYRVCGYINKTCTVYSNSVTVTSPYTPPEAVVPGTVTLTMNGTQASWTFGGTAPHGFKVLVGTSTGPTYGNHYKKYGASSSPVELTGLGSGTYYIVVCKLTGDSSVSGGCTDYSNEEVLVI